MEITAAPNGTAMVVSIGGTIDAMTAPQLMEYFNHAMQAGGSRWVADLAGLDYTSSAGLRVLLAVVKEARARGGDLRLAAIQPNVNRILDMSGFTGIIQCYPDVSAAVASFGA